MMVKDIKVESSKADTVFWGVIRPNFILDIKTDKKVGNFLVWEGCLRQG